MKECQKEKNRFVHLLKSWTKFSVNSQEKKVQLTEQKNVSHAGSDDRGRNFSVVFSLAVVMLLFASIHEMLHHNAHDVMCFDTVNSICSVSMSMTLTGLALLTHCLKSRANQKNGQFQN